MKPLFFLNFDDFAGIYVHLGESNHGNALKLFYQYSSSLSLINSARTNNPFCFFLKELKIHHRLTRKAFRNFCQKEIFLQNFFRWKTELFQQLHKPIPLYRHNMHFKLYFQLLEWFCFIIDRLSHFQKICSRLLHCCCCAVVFLLILTFMRFSVKLVCIGGNMIAFIHSSESAGYNSKWLKTLKRC